jgi:hypothetical protein
VKDVIHSLILYVKKNKITIALLWSYDTYKCCAAYPFDLLVLLFFLILSLIVFMPPTIGHKDKDK